MLADLRETTPENRIDSTSSLVEGYDMVTHALHDGNALVVLGDF